MFMILITIMNINEVFVCVYVSCYFLSLSVKEKSERAKERMKQRANVHTVFVFSTLQFDSDF